MPSEFGLMSLIAAAGELGITPATLRQQVKSGRLHAIKLGREWLVTEDEVNRYRSQSLGRPGRPPKHGRIA
jgi:excisionase family DNA binding protein